MSLLTSMWLIAAGTSLVGNAPVFAGFWLIAAGISELWVPFVKALDRPEKGAAAPVRPTTQPGGHDGE